MPRPRNLHRRSSGIYYARIHTPKDLIEVVEKKDRWISLKTTDPEEAKRRLLRVQEEWATNFESLRGRRTLNEGDYAAAVHEHFTKRMLDAERERDSKPTEEEILAAFDAAVAKARVERSDADAFDMINALTDVEILANRWRWGEDLRGRRLERLRRDLISGDTRLIEPEVDEFLAKRHIQVARTSDEYRELCRRVMRAEIQHLELRAKRELTGYDSRPTDPIIEEAAEVVKSLQARPGNKPTSEPDLMTLFSSYERERRARPESTAQAKRDVQHFADFVGKGAGPASVTNAAVRDWKMVLLDYPVKASETTIFKGLSAREVVALNKTLPAPKPTLAHQTIRRYMGSLNGFCTWMADNDYLEANPVTSLIPEKAAPTKKRTSFSDDALATLFGSPLFNTALIPLRIEADSGDSVWGANRVQGGERRSSPWLVCPCGMILTRNAAVRRRGALRMGRKPAGFCLWRLSMRDRAGRRRPGLAA